jgi:hypothetical protein
MNTMLPKQSVFRRATLAAAIGLAATLQTPGNAGAQGPQGPGRSPFALGIVSGWGPGCGYGYGCGFGGATVQGDILRGYGACFDGMGNLATGLGNYCISVAGASSVEADTWAKLDQYEYLCWQERQRLRHVIATNRKRIFKDHNDAKLLRLRENPSEADIDRGDALNILLTDLGGGELCEVARRCRTVLFDGRVLHDLPLLYGEAGLVICPARLVVGDRWPAVLREPAFASERREFERSVSTALDQAARGVLTAESAAAVDRTLKELRGSFKACRTTAGRSEQVEAWRFLEELSRSARMLHDPHAVRVLHAMSKYSGKTAGELVDFLRRSRLRFHVAESPTERELYGTVRLALAEHRDEVVARAAARNAARDAGHGAARPAVADAMPGADWAGR